MSLVVVGIIPISGGVRDDYPLVQSRCQYNVVDVYTVATVVQDYASNNTFSRDVEYVFPLPPSAAVCAFKAVLDDKKTIKGVVKEKKEAKKEYDAAVAQGKTAGLLQQEHADVFRVSLGNIKPKQKISVHISFVSIISHDGSSPQTLRITMPTAIAPRYGAPPTSIPWFGTNSQNRFELTVAVQMNKSVTSVSSPSHPIGLTLGCAQKELTGDFEPSKAFVYLSDQAFLDKDIVIVVSAQGMDTPRCTVERWLTSDGAENTTDAYALTLVPKFDLPALPRQEYIFLVDRSGSMKRGRMDSVKTSLQIMLRSLPSRNTTFNIVSFGTSHTALWPTSRTYSAESVEEASKHVDSFAANYGGTKIRSALEFAFSSRVAHGKTNAEDKVPASVFVLTDGEAWDLQHVVATVSNHLQEAKKSDCLLRAFVLGVGDQVSTAMCEGIARAGKGVATFVAEGEKPDTKLMNLLKAARGGVIEDLFVDWGVGPEKEEKDKKDMDDDDSFEMVEEPSTEASPPSPPINLFDDNAVDSSADVLGPEKAILNLPPPPLIQQAPKSDKLPIPLYPGFRCSIFAIIRQSSNPGNHSPHVKITGKVLGKDVVLQLPVTPVSIAGEITKDVVEGGRLLHTLAAKALIQQWEDMPSTPETKAQIERLGKRYTLASSVTSFLAIDEETKDEVQSAPQGEALLDATPSEQIAAIPNDIFGYSTDSSHPTRVSNSLSINPYAMANSYYNPGSPNSYRTRSSYSTQLPAENRLQAQMRSLPSIPSDLASVHIGFSSYGMANAANNYAPTQRRSGNYSALPEEDSLPGLGRKRSSRRSNSAIATPQPMDFIMSDSLTSVSHSEPVAVPQAPTPSTQTWYSQRPQQQSMQPQMFQPPPLPRQQQLMQQVQRQQSQNVLQQQQLQQRQQQLSVVQTGPRRTVHMSDPKKPTKTGSNWASSPGMDFFEPAPLAGWNGGPDLLDVGRFEPVSRFTPYSAQPMSPDKIMNTPAVPDRQLQPIGPRTVESLARAQNFDGSFPTTEQFTQMLFQSHKPLPAEPSELLGLVAVGGDIEKRIWITVLTLACLNKVFGGEDAWEMIAEKGKEFIENALMLEGVAGSVMQSMIAQLILNAENSFQGGEYVQDYIQRGRCTRLYTSWI